MAEFLATLVPALGHALLHFLWQGALIGLLTALALHTLRHARPQARYAVACLALLACVLVPLITVIAHLVVTSSAAFYAATPTPLPLISASPHTSGVLFGFAPTAQFDAFLPWIVALWAAGTCVMSLRMVLGLAWIRRLRNTPQGAAQAAWQVRLDALAMHFDLRRSVALRLVDTLDSPVSAGWWRPVVLLPTALLTRMPTDMIEALLAHELAHIRRHDYLVNLLQNAVEALLFYHPVTWWLSHRIRVEREQIADRLAAEVACAPRRLALALAELAELQRVHPALQLAQAARGGQLMSRIEQLVRPVQRAHPSARIVFPILGLAALCIASYAYAQIDKSVPNAMQPAPRATQASNTYTYNYNASVRAYAQIDKPVPNAMQPAPRATQSSRTQDASARDYAQIDKPVPIATQLAPREVQVSRAHNASARDTFALVRKGGNDILIRGPNDDMTAVDAAKLGLGGDLLWAYRGGQAYLVTDPSLYARARQAWRRAEALNQQLETLSGQMEAQQRRRDALAARQEALPVQPTEVRGARRAARLAMDDVARRQRELERRQGELEKLERAARSETAHQQIARERDALTVKQGELGDALVRLHDQYSEAMEAEARKQDELVRLQTEAMDLETRNRETQQQFATLSRERNQAADQATREVRNLISEALAKGLAKPAPTPVSAQ